LVHDLLNYFTGFGYWGVMFALMIVIVPSEIVLAYAGFLVAEGDITFTEAFVFGMIGGTIAQVFVYWVGRYGGRPFLEKYGKYLLIQKSHIELSEAWFNRYGRGVVFTARFVPVVHHAISIPAGMARMRLSTFTVYTALGLAPWTALFIYLGESLGAQWRNISGKEAHYIWPLIGTAIVLMALYLVYKRWQRKKRLAGKHSGLQGGQPGKLPGHIGEKNTADRLRSLDSNYIVRHSQFVSSRGGAAQEIDHIVIGPNGLFHIETKNWPGRIRFNAQGVERIEQDRLHHEDPTAPLYRHEFILKELLRTHKIEADVVGLLNFSNPDCNIEGKSPAFITVRLDQLLPAILNHQTLKPLSDRQVQAIADILEEHSMA